MLACPVILLMPKYIVVMFMADVLWHVVCLGKYYWQTLADVIPILYVVDVITTRQMVWPVMLSKVADVIAILLCVADVMPPKCTVAIVMWQILFPGGR